MSIQSLSSDTFIDIVSYCFPGTEVPQKEMSLLSSVCTLWRHQLVPEICLRELGKKTALTLREVEIYQKRLGSSGWDCIFQRCRQLKEVDFSFQSRKMSLLRECDFDLIFNSMKINCLNICSIHLAKNPTASILLDPSSISLVAEGYTITCAKVQEILKDFPHLAQFNITGHLSWDEYSLVKEKFPKTCISFVKIYVTLPTAMKITHKAEIEFEQNDTLEEIKERILEKFCLFFAPNYAAQAKGSAELVIFQDMHKAEIKDKKQQAEIKDKKQLQDCIRKSSEFSTSFTENPLSYFDKKRL